METLTYKLPALTASSLIPQLFDNQFLSDIHFIIENKFIYAHSFVLRCRSRLFNKLYALNQMKQMFPIANYSYEVFKQFIRFIYTDKCNLEKFDAAVDLLNLSVLYDIIPLENLIIANIMKRSLNTAERLKLLLFRESKPPDEYTRYSWIQDCVAPFVDELFESDYLYKITPTALENILQWNYIGREAKPFEEFDIFNIFGKWLVGYCEQNAIDVIRRRKIFGRILNYIRLPLMRKSEFYECMRQSSSLLQTEYMFAVDDLFYNVAGNTIPRQHYTRSKDCKWMERCYSIPYEMPTCISSIGTKLSGFQITSYYPISSVILRKEPATDSHFPIVFTFNDYQCRKYISLGDAVQIDLNCNYYIQIHVTKEGRIFRGIFENITNTIGPIFYAKRSTIHGYEIETFFKK